MHCPLCSFLPTLWKWSEITRESQEHPSSPDIFCDHDIFCDTVSTQKMVQLLSMNSLQRKRVLAVQVTGKKHLRGLEDQLKMMMSVIAAMLSTVKFFMVYMDLLYLIWFSQKYIEVIRQTLLYLLSRSGNCHSNRLNGSRTESQVFWSPLTFSLNYSLEVQLTEFIHFQLLNALSSWNNL